MINPDLFSQADQLIEARNAPILVPQTPIEASAGAANPTAVTAIQMMPAPSALRADEHERHDAAWPHRNGLAIDQELGTLPRAKAVPALSHQGKDAEPRM